MIVIGDKMTVTGLRLAGLKNTYVADEGSISSQLASVANTENMIVVTHALAKAADKDIERLRKQGKLMIELPDRTGGSQDIISQLIQETLGISLKK
jgi:vacuolar-type H+-ATPase subunit F/Vma7